MVATMAPVDVAVMKTTAMTVMMGGTYNNQLKAASEETMAAATTKVMETATETETAKVTATIITPKHKDGALMTVTRMTHQQYASWWWQWQQCWWWWWGGGGIA